MSLKEFKVYLYVYVADGNLVNLGGRVHVSESY